MTLEEFIEHIKLNKHLYYEEEFERIVGFLEELKALRVELEKNSKELEVYKKALVKACEELGNYYCCDAENPKCSMHDCGVHMEEHFLQKARENQ